MSQDFEDATTERSHPMGVVSLGFAVGAPLLGVLLSWPSGNFLVAIVATLLGGVLAAMLGQFAITDARERGDEPPVSAHLGRCLGWLDVIAPVVVAVLFIIALSRAKFVW